MMKLYQAKKVAMEQPSLNDAIAILNPGLLLEKAAGGLLKLSTELGLQVVCELMQEEVLSYVGKKGKHESDRTAYRHGTENTKVVLGEQKVQIKKPRVRGTDGVEIPLCSLKAVQNEDPLSMGILTHLLCGISTRKYARIVGAVEGGNCSTSKSTASRRFKEGMQKAIEKFFSRKITASYPVIMIDGKAFGKVMIIAAMGIDMDGHKTMLGFIEGGTENTETVKQLLSDLIDRGLDISEPRLFVLDGGKALHKGVKEIFGKSAVIQRCQIHKKRNVMAGLPESMKANVSIKLTEAYKEFDYEEAKGKLEIIARELKHCYPTAANSLLEGMEETLTLHKLKIGGLLRSTLSSTNALESANAVCESIVRRVTNFKNGETAIRQAAAGFLEAEKGFRRIKGYRELVCLKYALSRETGIFPENLQKGGVILNVA
jgi:transposase-like protein